MRNHWTAVISFLFATAFLGSVRAEESKELSVARATTPMMVSAKTRSGDSVPVPPEGIMSIVKFKSPVGLLSAYITPRPKGVTKSPAIIWLTGGDSNSLGDLWSPQPRDNDQTAVAFRKAGLVTMYPSLRGGNDNPGFREFNYGEVDDIVAAADYLGSLSYVDSSRIYLGGHSTGGTLVMVTAEMTKRFRAIFAFGPVADVRGYGRMMAIDASNEAQVRVRSPGYWLASVKTPVFAFEGDRQANTDQLKLLAKINANPMVKFAIVPGHSHFSILAPMTELIAKKILSDTGSVANITFSEQELRRVP